MTKLNATITSTAIGDRLRVNRTYKVDVPVVLVKAWLTIKVKETDPDPGFVQKDITTTITSKGHINKPDSTTVTAGQVEMLFDLLEADTGSAKAGKTYLYDVQVKTDSGAIYTLEKGTISFFLGVTIITT